MFQCPAWRRKLLSATLVSSLLLHLQAEVPAEVREVLEVIPCKRLKEVLQDAFDPPLNLAQPIVLARL